MATDKITTTVNLDDVANVIAFTMHVADLDPIAALTIANAALCVLVRGAGLSDERALETIKAGFACTPQEVADGMLDAAAEIHNRMLQQAADKEHK